MSEQKRGCGYRVLNALYLCGGELAVECDRLPFLLDVCPVCSQGFKQSRGFTEIDWAAIAGDHVAEVTIPVSLDEGCKDKFLCPLCLPQKGEIMLLMWVGRKFYTPDSFSVEAAKMGISKRIAFIPDNLILGKTWVLLAHPDACTVTSWLWVCDTCGDEFEIPELINENELPQWKDSVVDSVQVITKNGILYDPAWYRTTQELSRHAAKHHKKGVKFNMVELQGSVCKPGIFRAIIPTRVEMLITEEQSNDEEFMAGLKRRGITPVIYEPPPEEESVSKDANKA